MRKQIVRLTAALLAVGCIAPAMAQDKPARIVLETATGSVMASTGGDYASVEAGQELAQGASLMLGDGANATVAYYYEGQPKCTERYTGPNTYVVDETCERAVAADGSGKTIGIVAGGAALVAAMAGGGGGGGDDEPEPTPVSTGSN